MALDRGRVADLEFLSSQKKSASPAERVKIERTMHNIVNESPAIQSMRQELIRASRGGDVAGAKRIREKMNNGR